MPTIDFSKIEDVDAYKPLPEGQYHCVLVTVDEAKTHNGDDMWKLKFQIVSGEYEGRYIFDNMVFSPKSLKRVKLICNRLGVPTEGKIELSPNDLLDRECLLEVVIEEYRDNNDAKRSRNSVPFGGYAKIGLDGPAATHKQAVAGTSEEEMPF